MKVETKFGLGQMVYTLQDDKPILTEVIRIQIFLSLCPYTAPPQKTEYELLGVDKWYQEVEIFATEYELLVSLRGKTESLI